MIAVMVVIAAPALCGGASDANEGAPEDKQAQDYYKDTKHGWWWYEKEPEKPKDKKRKKKEVQTQEASPSLKDYPMEKLWTMPSSEFKELWGRFLEKAETEKTEAAGKEFWTVNDVARRRALAFTNITGYVMQKYPELSVNKDYPVATPGMNALTRQKINEIERTITASKDEFGLLYFYSPT